MAPVSETLGMGKRGLSRMGVSTVEEEGEYHESDDDESYDDGKEI
jgi:hypothetical protein